MSVLVDTQWQLDPHQHDWGKMLSLTEPHSISPAIASPAQMLARSPFQENDENHLVHQWLHDNRAILAQANQRGTRDRDRLVGSNRRDVLKGLEDNDALLGKGGSDRLLGHNGNDRLVGGSGDDMLIGGKGGDRLSGGGGDDILEGGQDQDVYQGGSGRDIVRIQLNNSGLNLQKTDILKGFQDGQDLIDLRGVDFDQLKISQGTGKNSNHVLIQQRETGNYLLLVQNTRLSDLTQADFLVDSNPETEPDMGNGGILVSVSRLDTNLGAIDNANEAAVQALGGPTLTIGTQHLYIGYRQVSSSNQDPTVISFDSENPANNWVRTDYEITNADSRGYGLFWSGTDLYGVFSVDGTQGTPQEDFRRVSSDATTNWIRSYGQGGGAKIAVVARLDLATGALLDAAYISAVLTDGKTNSLRVNDFSGNASGNVLIHTESRFYPRNVDGTPMLNVGNTPAPFDYTVELTSDLNQVVGAIAIGVQ